ncbi:MAG: hypothetical protein CMF52_03340 [Legionellales bacterium]|nr:hypothetical protein [Legionellales bacterium]|tara:strand:- start:351 stop:920 length:570 start_codon:yes stop_codon:yes gene_type:complete
MPQKTISGMKGKSPIRTRLEILKSAGEQFKEMGIVCGNNSTNAVMQAENILTALNVSISHEKFDFSLVDSVKNEQINREQTREAILLLEPTPIKATDKFKGTDPQAGQVSVGGIVTDIKRSSFYELDPEPSKVYKESARRKDSNKQNLVKIAMAKSLATPTAKRPNRDSSPSQSTNEKYRSSKRSRSPR